ncbi:BQ5605_C041g11981 [Microbotryum silenes-dioicae]|uniref:BQ5605_C041g11981 protein n=1 Tax=Microbotryum silenes-dioicae TaxID=796604 RepID=A0A2X0NCL4_9BASI|nr:BQ5605_C041g11981 [Microbotryum silenes-dioicae]
MGPTKRRINDDAPSKQASHTMIMGKRRKHGAAEEVSPDPVEQLNALKAYMHHALKLLHKVVKKSKTFELQKLTRKLKRAGETEGVATTVVADLEAQLDALKGLPIDPLATHILHTRLGKISSPTLSKHLPTLTASLPAQVPPTTTETDATSTPGKARNRVLANKTVHEGWEEIVRAIKKRLGEEVAPRPVAIKAVPAKSPSKDKKSLVQDGVGVTSSSTNGTKLDASPGPAVVGERRLSKRAERKLKGELKAKQPREMTIDPQRLKAMQRASERERGDDEEDGGDEDGGEFGIDDDEVRRELEALGGDGGTDWSGSESGAEDEADDDDDGASIASDSSFPVVAASKATTPKVKAKSTPVDTKLDKRPKKESTTTRPITSSAFLPSLAAGYVSYSDSDDDDAKWVKDAERQDKREEKRKNRRGQRARQAIWEKKYGSGANHVVKETGGAAAAQKGGKASSKKAITKAALNHTVTPYDPTKTPGAANNPNAAPVGQRKIVRPTVTYKTSTPIVPIEIVNLSSSGIRPADSTRSAPVVRGKPLVEEGMHPSWEAKRRAQEALLNSANAPKGKKITFSSSGAQPVEVPRAAPVARGKSLVEEGMHPSWEAKRRAQEAQLSLANAPKGKKITFD